MNSSIAFFVVLTVVAGNVHATPVSDCSAHVSIPAEGVSLPLRYGSKGHLIVDAQVNGVSQPLVIDTGGMGIGGSLDRTTAERVQPAGSRSSTSAQGAHHSGPMDLMTIDRLDLGGASVESLPFLLTPRPLFRNDDDAGLLGSRFLCQFLVEIDLNEGRMRLFDRTTVIDTLVDAGWAEIPFENFHGTGGIIIETRLDGTPVKAALDTGSYFTGVNWAAAAQTGIDRNHPGLRQREEPGHGLMADATPIRFHELGFEISLADGRITRQDDAVRINDIPAMKQLFGDQPGMIVGMNVLDGRRLVMDYRRSKLYLR